MTNNESTNVLLVVGIDSVGLTRLPRLLCQAGARVTLLSSPGFAVVRSRFVSGHIAAPADPAALAEALRLHLAAHNDKYGWILLADEPSLQAVAVRYEEEWTSACLPVERTPLTIELITEKLPFLIDALDAALPAPSLEVCLSREEVAEAVESVGYPLMLKISHGMGGAGVRFARTPEDLAAIDWKCTPHHPIAVQRFVGGTAGSSEVLYDRGRPAAWICSYHREFWPTPLATSCVRELTDLPEIEAMLIEIGEMTGFHGLAGIDWLQDERDGRLHLIEFNARPTPCYHLGPRVGVDFPAALADVWAGRVTLRRPQKPAGGWPVVYQFPQYLYRAIDDRAFHRLWRMRTDVPWRDPLLVAAHLRRALTHYLPAGWKTGVKRLIKRERSRRSA